MPERVMTCEDCGHHEITNYANQKRCDVCRTLKNMLFVGLKQRKCWRCSTKFLPIARDDQACGRCALTSRRQQPCTCAICGQEGIQAVPELRLCMGCARDKRHRRDIIRALEEKQLLRQQTDWGAPPALDALAGDDPAPVI